jgi:tRNA(fMet)-specific endonuclease VapC
MSLYVLDTDHVTLLGYGHAQVVARLAATPPNDRAITIITVEEQLRAGSRKFGELGMQSS